MKVLLKHILRNIRENKFRSVLIVLSLTISTVVMFMSLTIKDDIAGKYEQVLRGTFQDYDLQAYQKGDDIKKYSFSQDDVTYDKDQINNLLFMNVSNGIYFYGSSDDEYTEVNVIGSDRNICVNDDLMVFAEKSKNYDPTSSNQVVISKKNAEKYSLKLDDKIKIFSEGKEYTFTISAIAEAKGFFLTENDSFFLMSDMKTANLFNETENKVTSVYFDVADGVDLDDAIDNIKISSGEFDVNKLVDMDSIDEALKTINKILYLILALVIGLNFYVISSITKRIMSMRIPVVGTFRSVGATRKKMNSILILENAVYGVIASIFGIAIGMMTRNAVSGIFINAGDAFDYMDVKYSMKPIYIIGCVTFTVGLQVLISLSSILKVSRKSIKDTIFNTVNTVARLSIKKTVAGFILVAAALISYTVNTKYSLPLCMVSLVGGLVGTVFIVPFVTNIISKLLTGVVTRVFGGAAGLGVKNISTNKTTKTNIRMVTLCVSILMMVYILISSMDALFDRFDDKNSYDIEIHQVAKPEEDTDYIKDWDSIKSVNYVYYSYISEGADMNGSNKPFVLIGVRDFIDGIDFNDCEVKDLGDNDVIVDEFFAFMNDIEIGDTITLDGDSFLDHNMKFNVKGFADTTYMTTNRNCIIMNLKSYKSIYDEYPAWIDICVNDGHNVDDVKKDLVKAFAGTGARIATIQEQIDESRDSNQSLINLVDVLLVISLILAAFGLINNQMIGFSQRKKELAVLYSVSMSKGQLKTMLLFEALSSALLGTTYASLIGIFEAAVLGQILFSIGLALPVFFSVGLILKIFLIVLAVLILTMSFPIRKIRKIKVVEEIKYE